MAGGGPGLQPAQPVHHRAGRRSSRVVSIVVGVHEVIASIVI